MIISDVLAELALCVPWAKFPALTENDVYTALYKSKLIDSNKRKPDQHKIWQASRAYVIGETVVPSIFNGYYYTVIAGGTSDTYPPVWPVVIGEEVAEGLDGLLWSTTGQALWLGAFDINYAASLLWTQKATLVAHMTQTSVDGQSFNPQQLRTQFLDMAKTFRRKRGIRSVAYTTAQGYARYYPEGYTVFDRQAY